MPVLPSALAESSDEAAKESGSFSALDPGIYTGRLGKCDAIESRAGKPMWALEFDQIHDLEGNKKGGRLWSNITLEESVAWKIAQFFSAFGVPTSTNTDHLLNNRIRLEVSKRVQTMGKNTGKEVNDIDRFSVLLSTDDGYEKGQQLIARLAKETRSPAPVKATAKKATAAKVPDDDVVTAGEEIAELAAEEDDDVDF